MKEPAKSSRQRRRVPLRRRVARRHLLPDSEDYLRALLDGYDTDVYGLDADLAEG